MTTGRQLCMFDVDASQAEGSVGGSALPEYPARPVSDGPSLEPARRRRERTMQLEIVPTTDRHVWGWCIGYVRGRIWPGGLLCALCGVERHPYPRASSSTHLWRLPAGTWTNERPPCERRKKEA